MNTRPIDPILLDRLVDGELDPGARRDLLLALDATPDGWRRCALAFLEAQEFGRAARAWASEHQTAEAVSPPPAPRPRRTSPSRLARAALVVGLAFLAGLTARGRTRPDPEVPVARDDTKPAPTPSPSVALASPDEEPGPDAWGDEPPPMPEYVRAQWQRLGYQVERTRQVILTEEAGRPRSIPIEGYRIEFVGRPTY